MFDWIEGSRTFDVTWGIVAAAACLAAAVPLLWWVLPNTKRSYFGPQLDPEYKLQLAFGIFGMALASTNLGCRLIDHGPLEAVHPTFFVVSVVYVAGLLPRVLWLASNGRRNASPRSRPT